MSECKSLHSVCFQASQQGHNVQVTILLSLKMKKCKIVQEKRMSVPVAPSVAPGSLKASIASSPSLWPTSSNVTTQAGHSSVTLGSCVNRGSVLKLRNMI